MTIITSKNYLVELAFGLLSFFFQITILSISHSSSKLRQVQKSTANPKESGVASTSKEPPSHLLNRVRSELIYLLILTQAQPYMKMGFDPHLN